MNKTRQSRIENVIREIEARYNILESLKNEEEFSYDNIPENLLDSDRAVRSEEIIDELSDILDDFSDIIDRLKGVF